MNNKLTNRRRFLQQLIGAPFASQAALGTLASMAASPDSFNMVVPSSNTEYGEYAQARQNLAVDQNALLGINPLVSDGAEYGVHPAMPEVQSMFNAGDLAVAANVGALVEPTTRNDLQSNLVKLPPNLFSHNSQQDFWQSVEAFKAQNIGWAGRLADRFSSMLLTLQQTEQSHSTDLGLLAAVRPWLLCIKMRASIFLKTRFLTRWSAVYYFRIP